MFATAILGAGVLLVAQSLPPPSAPGAMQAGPPPVPAPISTLGSASLAGWVVVLDPGHGGNDPGAEAGDVREAWVARDLAERTAALLTAQGARVLLTREADDGPDPDVRAATANRAHGHVFISLHVNRSPRPEASGAEIYTHMGAGAGSATGTGTTGAVPRLPLVRWDQVQDRHTPASEALAGHLEAALGGRIPMGKHPRQRLPLRALAGVDMPALLLEVAYLSNPAQAAAVVTAEFQTTVAEAIRDALLLARPSPSAGAGR